MADVWHQGTAGEPPTTTRRRERDRRIAELARQQHGVIARDQLNGAGFSRQAIRHRLNRGLLFQVHPSVYAVGAQPLTQIGRWYAALLATLPSPALSHLSSVAKRGLAAERDGVHVTVTHSRGRTLRGVTVHRCRHFHPADVTRLDGLPVTTLPRTLLDLAETETPDRLAKVLEEADRRELLDLDALRECALRNPGRRGIAPLIGLIDRYIPTPGAKEGMERDFALLLREEGLPLPEVNVLVHGILVDCWWPEARFVVELDSRSFHATWEARERDLARDATLLREGIPTLRVTDRRMRRERARLVADLRSLVVTR